MFKPGYTVLALVIFLGKAISFVSGRKGSSGGPCLSHRWLLLSLALLCSLGCSLHSSNSGAQFALLSFFPSALRSSRAQFALLSHRGAMFAPLLWGAVMRSITTGAQSALLFLTFCTALILPGAPPAPGRSLCSSSPPRRSSSSGAQSELLVFLPGAPPGSVMCSSTSGAQSALLFLTFFSFCASLSRVQLVFLSHRGAFCAPLLSHSLSLLQAYFSYCALGATFPPPRRSYVLLYAGQLGSYPSKALSTRCSSMSGKLVSSPPLGAMH